MNGTEIAMQNRLEDLLYEMGEIDEVFEGVEAQTYANAGVLSDTAGLFITLSDGTQFAVSIVEV